VYAPAYHNEKLTTVNFSHPLIETVYRNYGLAAD
jgi:hypothetical protein